MRLALYQPEIPQNAGTIMRFCAAMGLPLDIIEPCGFAFDQKKLRRAAMDYIDHLDYTRHANWAAFAEQLAGRRLVLLTTRAAVPYTEFAFDTDDILLAGQESAGVPEEVHAAADARLLIPMVAGLRSLNLAVSCAMVGGEALRQTDGFHRV
ncbi:MAG: tRNA (cytidine(34)-2'-O)-methyltransferase [Pseudomonadota bacterium]